MPNPALDPEVKAKIQGMLLSGMKPKEIVEELGISHSSVSRAKAAIPKELLAKMDEEQQAVIVDLVTQQLEAGLEASIVIAQQASNDRWRNEQDAAKLATFYGVITDKSIRLLEAGEAASLAARGTSEPIDAGSSIS